MGRRAQLPTLARLELSQAAYDEIERKLLEAGHEHRFERGPGTAIDMTGIWVEREASTVKSVPRPTRAAVHKGMVMAGLATEERQPLLSREEIVTAASRMLAGDHERYCVHCDRVVTQPCERVDCREAANQKERNAKLDAFLDRRGIGHESESVPSQHGEDQHD